MRINVYSQELITDPEALQDRAEYVSQKANTGILYSGVRLLFHSSPRLHHPPLDDDRSAITFWLPKSRERREELASTFEYMAALVRKAPPETGLD